MTESHGRTTPPGRGIVVLLAVGAAFLAIAAGALAATGDLTQKAGTAGCVSETGTAGACQDGKALEVASGVAASPDGTSVYVASQTGGVAIFDRTADGALTQKAGTAGCVSETGAGPCQDGVALAGAAGVAVSPDGKSVYVASVLSDAVAIFDRAADGALTQKAGTMGCVSETGAGPCQDGVALDGAFGVAASADGKSVYVASFTSDAVAIFDRAADGALAQKTGMAGCVSETGAGPCQDGVALDGAFGVAASADGKSVYVTSQLSSAVTIFDRAADGALTQKAGMAGCVSETGAGPCQDGVALDNARGVAVSPDGKSVYVASLASDAVAILDRAAGTGELTQKAGTTGCVSETGAGPCQDGTALDGAQGVAVSPDGKSIYVASTASDAVAILDRNTAGTGELTQKAGTAGCVSEDGTGGACQDGTALDFARGVAVSADGKSVYVASFVSDAVAIFNREDSPETQIDSGPSGATNDNTPTFAFSSDEQGVSFECRVDADAFGACSGPGASHTTAQLGDGAHTFAVRAKDSFGTADPTPAERTFTVDTTLPDTAAPDLKLSGKKVQRFRRAVTVKATCADEACTALAKGTVKVSPPARSAAILARARTFKLKPDTEQLAAGVTEKLKLKARRKARNAILEALERGQKAVATVKVTATDAAGNSRSKRRKIRLRR